MPRPSSIAACLTTSYRAALHAAGEPLERYYLLALNLAYGWRNDELAIDKDLVFVTDCAAMVAVTWTVGAGGPSWSPA